MTTSKGARVGILALAVGLLAAGVATTGTTAGNAGTAAAIPVQTGCDNRNNNTYEKLLECVRVEGVREHQAAFQAIADANGGNRAAGTPGTPPASSTWSTRSRRPAGTSRSTSSRSRSSPPPTLQQLTPVNADLRDGGLHGHRHRDGDGQRHPGRHQPRPAASVDERLRGRRLRRLDFSGPADIALIQRGTCTFGVKALERRRPPVPRR